MKKVTRIIIAIIYIFWSIYAPLTAIDAIIALDISALIGVGIGLVTFVAGVLGLIGKLNVTRRILGAVVFVVAAGGVAVSMGSPNLITIATALVAWFYIMC